ncbi:polymerase [Nitrincola lacisaponensis]|uniref:Polymerase n=1 Tax=Nitrincola lacisaponensis TaxID=267850 RepID=A0A063Y9X3_9GAMM|nr:hypothetical protein [Nitrincola lacisaponensis]KDE41137.1 polymerase [Nitrincola lacisaponensis]
MKPLDLILLLPVFYLFIVLYSFFGVYVFDFGKNVPFQLYRDTYSEGFFFVLWGYVFASLSFIVGALLVKFLAVNKEKVILYNYFSKPRVLNVYIVILFFMMFIVVMHMGMGVSHIYYRDGYVIDNESGSAVFRLLQVVLLPVVAVTLALTKKKKLGFFLFLILYIYVLGLSSRYSMVVPVFYYFGLIYRNNNYSVLGLVVVALVSLLSLLASVSFRDNIQQGVFPNLYSLVMLDFNYELFMYSLNYIFSYSVIAATYVVENHVGDGLSFIYSITPVPSMYIDVQYLTSSQKINEHAPFPAISILLLSGYHYLILYYIFSGMIWMFVLRFFHKKSLVGYMVVTCLFILFVVLATQYNLRSVTRLVYYSIFLYLIFIIALQFKLKRVR